MQLDRVRRGDLVKITAIADARLKEQALRMGIEEGAVFSCVEAIPAGPVVLGKHRQEVAVGRDLARRVIVELLTRAGVAQPVPAALESEVC